MIRGLSIAMLSIHSSPTGALGTRDTGGMSVHIRGLSAALARRGHFIDVFTCRGDAGDPEVTHLAPGVRLVRLPLRGRGPVAKAELVGHVDGIAGALETFVERGAVSYDLLHSHYWISGLVAERSVLRRTAPHAITFHTLAAVKNALACGEHESERRVRGERGLAGSCDAVVVTAERERMDVIRYCGVSGRKIRLIPCGVDLAGFPLGNRGEARALLGWPPGRRVLLFVGRFTPVKGLDRLLRSLPALAIRYPDLELAVIGGDGLDSESGRSMRALACQLEVDDRIRWLGRVEHPDLAAYYAAADAVAVPSHSESFGLVALEALACGTPVVATRVGALDEIIRDGRNGVLVSRPVPELLAGGIARLLDAAKAPASALRRTVAAYDWNTVARIGEEVYRELLGAEPGPLDLGSAPAQGARSS